MARSAPPGWQITDISKRSGVGVGGQLDVEVESESTGRLVCRGPHHPPTGAFITVSSEVDDDELRPLVQDGSATGDLVPGREDR